MYISHTWDTTLLDAERAERIFYKMLLTTSRTLIRIITLRKYWRLFIKQTINFTKGFSLLKVFKVKTVEEMLRAKMLYKKLVLIRNC